MVQQPSCTDPSTGETRSKPTRLTRAGLAEAARVLATRDTDLARVLRAHGPPPLWARPASYATLVLIILEQQVSLASARSAFDRLARRTGEVAPGRILALGPSQLRSLGLTRQKARYVVELATAIESGNVNLRGVAGMNDDDARAALMTVPGIGHWTANIYLLMALRRPDVWPVYDLALRQSFKRLRGLTEPPSDQGLATQAKLWRPYRSVAARILWHSYLAERRDASG